MKTKTQQDELVNILIKLKAGIIDVFQAAHLITIINNKNENTL